MLARDLPLGYLPGAPYGGIAVGGMQNVGLVLAQKQLNFQLEFWHSVAAKALSVVAAIIAGFTLGDYRALLIGIATGYIGSTLLSYAMHPYRPRWNTLEARSIWNVSKWLMVGNMGGYLLGKADELAAVANGADPHRFLRRCAAAARGLGHQARRRGQRPAKRTGHHAARSITLLIELGALGGIRFCRSGCISSKTGGYGCDAKQHTARKHYTRQHTLH